MLQEADIRLRLSQRGSLSFKKAEKLILLLSQSTVSEDEKVAFLSSLHEKEATSEEIAGFASGVRSLALLNRIPGVLDIVGTGGDLKNTINVSTCAALVCSSLGVKIAKHGNRAATGVMGSADFLEKLGYDFEFTQKKAEKRIKNLNFIFILAGLYNPVFARFRDARKRLNHETVFNLLGPITNPCDPDMVVIGCTTGKQMSVYEKTLQELGKRGIIVNAADGMDEISPLSDSNLSIVNGGIHRFKVNPADQFGTTFDLDTITGKTREELFQKTLDSISGEDEYGAKFIAMNASPALFLSKKSANLKRGYELALKGIKTKKALAFLRAVTCNGDSSTIGEIYG